VKKAGAVFAQTFFKQRWKSSRKVAEGHLHRFPWLRQFPQASPAACSFFLVLFLSCENPHVYPKVFRARIV
jgi:hypothetical protein